MRWISAIALVVMLFLTSCSSKEPLPGEELILDARKDYRALDSARVEIVNDITGETEQTFTFKYDEKGIMVYSYTGDSDGVHLKQFNNGREQFTYDNGVVTVLSSADLDFTAYSRDVPYPMADEGLILFYKNGIIPEKCLLQEVSLQGAANPITHIKHEYDVSKISSEYSGEGELKSFSVDYNFDCEGNLLDFIESAEIANDGETKSYRYLVKIYDKNAVEKVENVVDISDIDN